MALHWTERSVDDYLYRIASDFVLQLEKKMEAEPYSQTKLASKLGVSKGRVSQILNNPGNLTLKMIIKCARALNMKIAIVAYDDNDKLNEKGPINSQVFITCWERAGKPADFVALERPSHSALSAGKELIFQDQTLKRISGYSLFLNYGAGVVSMKDLSLQTLNWELRKGDPYAGSNTVFI
jgi:transcriptional regulator with XRE-family HTH domain